MSSAWEFFSTDNFRKSHSTRDPHCDYLWFMLKICLRSLLGPVCVKLSKWYRYALSTCLFLFVLRIEKDPIVETLRSVRNIIQWPKPRTAPILSESERWGTDLIVFTHIRGVCFLRLCKLGAAGVRTHGYSVLPWRKPVNVTNKTQFYNFQRQKFIKWLLFGWHYHYNYQYHHHDFSTLYVAERPHLNAHT
jgi:hypothetical protein